VERSVEGRLAMMCFGIVVRTFEMSSHRAS
jgi:hypothetical protein